MGHIFHLLMITPWKLLHNEWSTKWGIHYPRSSVSLLPLLIMKTSSWQNGISWMVSSNLIAQQAKSGTLPTSCRYWNKQAPSLLCQTLSKWDGLSSHRIFVQCLKELAMLWSSIFRQQWDTTDRINPWHIPKPLSFMLLCLCQKPPTKGHCKQPTSLLNAWLMCM